jgi:ribulose-phosphate 3-epimerase
VLRINPSVLSADFANMERDLQTIATADAVHVDIMDNHFVPNLTFGVQMTQRIQDTSPIPLDVHLMIDNPLRWAPDYAKTGAECVTFHVEATDNPREVIAAIHDAGSKAGISVKPGTPVEPYLDLIGEVEQFLVMTVEPGFGGQAFMPDVLPKLDTVASVAADVNPGLWIQVDGGISLTTIAQAVAHGANTLVAGSAVFRPGIHPADAIAELRHTALTAHTPKETP